jgi:RIO-like serine/threonine protein kinase
MRLDDLSSYHPNILKGVIMGKKSWGLWLQQWTDGIVEGSFTEREILNEFTSKGIKIPEPLMIDWDNVIIKKINKRINGNN